MRIFPFVIRCAAGGVLAATTVMTAIPAGAQDASPAAGASGTTCTVEPRDAEEIVGFFFDPAGTPLATPAAAVSVASEAELPQGEPVDPAVEEAVNATVTELIACFEAGQYARAFALMTDDMARQMGPDVSSPDEDTPEEVLALLEAQLAGTPVVDEPGMEQGASMSIGPGRDIRVLDGGRVGGIWTIGGDAAFIVLEQQDDRWLIDEVIDIAEDGAASGTPTS